MLAWIHYVVLFYTSTYQDYHSKRDLTIPKNKTTTASQLTEEGSDLQPLIHKKLHTFLPISRPQVLLHPSCCALLYVLFCCGCKLNFINYHARLIDLCCDVLLTRPSTARCFQICLHLLDYVTSWNKTTEFWHLSQSKEIQILSPHFTRSLRPPPISWQLMCYFIHPVVHYFYKCCLIAIAN